MKKHIIIFLLSFIFIQIWGAGFNMLLRQECKNHENTIIQRLEQSEEDYSEFVEWGLMQFDCSSSLGTPAPVFYIKDDSGIKGMIWQSIFFNIVLFLLLYKALIIGFYWI